MSVHARRESVHLLVAAALLGLLNLSVRTGLSASLAEPPTVSQVHVLGDHVREAAPRRWTADDVLQRIASASAQVQCIVGYEVGRGVTRDGLVYEPYDPYMPGGFGEIGPGQLASFGLLDEFHRWARARGWGPDPYDPHQIVAFMEVKLAEGEAAKWAPVALGHC